MKPKIDETITHFIKRAIAICILNSTRMHVMFNNVEMVVDENSEVETVKKAYIEKYLEINKMKNPSPPKKTEKETLFSMVNNIVTEKVEKEAYKGKNEVLSELRKTMQPYFPPTSDMLSDARIMKTLKKMLLQKAEEIAILQADLRSWIRLGKMWRKSIPTNYALCPSDAGIKASESLVGPVKEPEEYEIYDVLKEIRMEYVDVRIQDKEASWIVYYEGKLHMSLLSTGKLFKIENKYYIVKDVIVDLSEDSNPIVLLVERIHNPVE